MYVCLGGGELYVPATIRESIDNPGIGVWRCSAPGIWLNGYRTADSADCVAILVGCVGGDEPVAF